MLKSIEIRNYKSIEKLALPLGRINVLIGENGAGKSNILEAIALAGAASAGKLDNEFLASRGIRVTQPQLMRAGFAEGSEGNPVEVIARDGNVGAIDYKLTNDNSPYSQWKCEFNSGIPIEEFIRAISPHDDGPFSTENITAVMGSIRKLSDAFKKALEQNNGGDPSADISVELPMGLENFVQLIMKEVRSGKELSAFLDNFVIYSPENTSLRMFSTDSQIEPLGINGEGLLKLLTVLSAPEYESSLTAIKEGLKLFGWFEDFHAIPEQGGMPGGMTITDRYLAAGLKAFDQKSSNEGFLFLAFYFALFSTELTPKFFAIDNIDASLNPKLCERLISYLTKLAVQHDKQVILTTHNPAVLDGLNLDDDDQRLFVVSRGPKGQTKLKRFVKPPTREGAEPIRLSEAFLRGSLGGLPKRF